jgi:hypothetical protein
MFSFFRKKSGHKIVDVVFATKEAKWKAIAELAKQDSTTVFVAWFEESRDSLQQYFDASKVEAEVIDHHVLHNTNNKLVFIEHYPLAEKEKALFALLSGPALVYSSLDDPLFRLFGGDKIASLLTKMGLDDNEGISHPMITQSIYKAQEKLAAKITIDHSAHSMQEWMEKNTGTIIQ